MSDWEGKAHDLEPIEAALGALPVGVETPGTWEAVGEAVCRASEQGHTVVPWGGGFGQTYGYVPVRPYHLLALNGLNRILAVEPGDLTVTVEAGATLGQVQAALAEHGQFLPLDPPHSETATIGGILATDAWGPSRLGFGTARDWLIGIAVVDGQGRRVQGGGKVVKNVTGYDLPKLHTGALGTLGVIVEATFKVAPLPEASRGLLLTMPTNKNKQAAFLARLHNETAPTISLLREVPGGGRVLGLVYTGFEEVVNGERDRALNIAHAHGSEPTSLPEGIPPLFTTPPPPDVPLILRVGKDRANGLGRHLALADLAPWQWIDTLPGTGHTDLYLSPDADSAAVFAQMVQYCERERAHFAVLHAPTTLRVGVGERAPLWFPLPSHFPLLARTKAALDPGNVCNAGRFVGGL